MIDFSRTLREILDAYPSVRAIVVRPLLRTGPGSYTGDLSVLQVLNLLLFKAYFLPFDLVLSPLSTLWTQTTIAFESCLITTLSR